MNVYEIGSLKEKLAGNTYPGRGIVLGISPDGKKAVAEKKCIKIWAVAKKRNGPVFYAAL